LDARKLAPITLATSGDLGTLDAAIAVCDDNIKRHGGLAEISMVSGIVLLVAIVIFAGYYAGLTADVRDKKRTLQTGVFEGTSCGQQRRAGRLQK
jgi:hypothetical protein